MFSLEEISTMNYYTDVLKKYAVFSGRAPRKEYWMFTLWNSIIYLVLAIVGNIIIYNSTANSGLFAGIILTYGYGLAVLLPSLGVFVRRLHDTDHSGAWFFYQLNPAHRPDHIACLPLHRQPAGRQSVWAESEGDSTTTCDGRSIAEQLRSARHCIILRLSFRLAC
jgi:uncharacterized membrane protein YhaH (DUF805 family)